MEKIGSVISVGTKGICEIVDIKENAFEGAVKGKLYYILKPVENSNNMRVYLPVDTNLKIRKLVSKKEANSIIENFSAAKEIDVPVIALSQLSRAAEQRPDNRPMLSDLRESGSIEQDADIVMFLYRDDYYNPETEKKNIAEVIVAKNRQGSTGTVELAWLPNYTKFANLYNG